jgi:hypothetical protein
MLLAVQLTRQLRRAAFGNRKSKKIRNITQGLASKRERRGRSVSHFWLASALFWIAPALFAEAL